MNSAPQINNETSDSNVLIRIDIVWPTFVCSLKHLEHIMECQITYASIASISAYFLHIYMGTNAFSDDLFIQDKQ